MNEPREGKGLLVLDLDYSQSYQPLDEHGGAYAFPYSHRRYRTATQGLPANLALSSSGPARVSRKVSVKSLWCVLRSANEKKPLQSVSVLRYRCLEPGKSTVREEFLLATASNVPADPLEVVGEQVG